MHNSLVCEDFDEKVCGFWFAEETVRNVVKSEVSCGGGSKSPASARPDIRQSSRPGSASPRDWTCNGFARADIEGHDGNGGVKPRGVRQPWLYRVVAGNLIRNEYRRQARDAELRLRLSHEATEPAGTEASDLTDRVAWSEQLDAVVAALRTLNDNDQEVLRLHAWEGLAGKDLAVALGCTTGSAAVRLHRARRRLERALASTRPATPAPARSTSCQEGLRP